MVKLLVTTHTKYVLPFHKKHGLLMTGRRGCY